jgi:hypothetical protein
MFGIKPRRPFRNKAIYSIGKRYCIIGKNIFRTKSKRYSAVYCWKTNARDSNICVKYYRGNASDSKISIHAKAKLYNSGKRMQETEVYDAKGTV